MNDWSFPDLKSFIAELRRYEKNSLIEMGVNLIYSSLHEYLENLQNPLLTEDEKRKPIQGNRVIRAYAPRIIMLALAAANNARNLKVDYRHFRQLCYAYMNIKAVDEEFIKKESEEIIQGLRTTELKDYIRYNENKLRQIPLSIDSLVGRLAALQTRHIRNLDFRPILTDIQLILKLDRKLGGYISRIFKRELELDINQTIRALFRFCMMLLIYSGEGIILSEKDMEGNKFNITDIERVVSFFSIKESSLRRDWLEGRVLKQPIYYQPYYPLPSFNNLAIELEKGRSRNIFVPPERVNYAINSGIFTIGSKSFLVPEFDVPLTNFSDIIGSFIFSEAKKDKRKDIGSVVGEVIESHIYEVLCAIFGKNKLTRLDNEAVLADRKHADFVIDLPKVKLLIEVKTDIGGNEALSVLRPKNIATIWERLLKACQQCSASVKWLNAKGNQKPIIPIILMAYNIVLQAESFSIFAKKLGVYTELELSGVSLASWNNFQAILAQSSLEQFEAYLVEHKELPSLRPSKAAGEVVMNDYSYLDDMWAFVGYKPKAKL